LQGPEVPDEHSSQSYSDVVAVVVVLVVDVDETVGADEAIVGGELQSEYPVMHMPSLVYGRQNLALFVH